jgi:hypothetical protein
MSAEIRRLLDDARTATGTLRDAAREGREIGFRQRDPLVMAIHQALDKLEELALPVLPQDDPLEKNDARVDLQSRSAPTGSTATLPPDSSPHWQPIETAPKDGRTILVVVEEHAYPGGRPTFAYWDGEWAWWCERGFTVVLPTHWLSLPLWPGAVSMPAAVDPVVQRGEEGATRDANSSSSNDLRALPAQQEALKVDA